jgi:hypothetical protein
LFMFLTFTIMQIGGISEFCIWHDNSSINIPDECSDYNHCY